MASPSTGPSSSAPRNTGSASTVIFRLPVLIDTSPSTVTMAANIASAARRRAVHFVCICKTPFVTVATAGVFPWWQRKRQQHRGARDPFVAGQLPIPAHLTRCSYSVQCIAQISVCIIAHAAQLCKPQKKDARVGVLFCLMSYFFARVRRRVSSSTSPSTSS